MVKISSREYCSARSAHEVDPAAPGRGQCECGANWVQKNERGGLLKKGKGAFLYPSALGSRGRCAQKSFSEMRTERVDVDMDVARRARLVVLLLRRRGFRLLEK